mmetsp:Transcript_27394/g.49324  ORF Transcript_27394/g.49324 Transcript_27394/m.49324 type:complete len:211 (-) Transcript_27394:1814-2446(-)
MGMGCPQHRGAHQSVPGGFGPLGWRIIGPPQRLAGVPEWPQWPCHPYVLYRRVRAITVVCKQLPRPNTSSAVGVLHGAACKGRTHVRLHPTGDCLYGGEAGPRLYRCPIFAAHPRMGDVRPRDSGVVSSRACVLAAAHRAPAQALPLCALALRHWGHALRSGVPPEDPRRGATRRPPRAAGQLETLANVLHAGGKHFPGLQLLWLCCGSL